MVTEIRKDSSGYVVLHDDGRATRDAKLYDVQVGDVLCRGICVGVNAIEGWADVLVQDDGSEEGYVGPIIHPRVPKYRFEGDRLVIKRIFGHVSITRKEVAIA